MKIPALADFRRVVVKVGSSLLVDRRAGRLRESWLASLTADLAEFHRDKRDVLVVSSGAIALGRAVLKLPAGPLKLEDSQAAAAVGQIALARTWTEALSQHGIIAGQVLVTLGDTEERRRYLNARSTIDTLLQWRAIPVINENDTVATNEIRYGDNDRLGARVATMMSADLLVLLSDVDGLYDAPPDSGCRRPAHTLRTAHHRGDRGDGRRGRLRALARRHADQDRGGADRDQCRDPHGHRLRRRRASAARHHRRRALHLVPDPGQSGYGPEKMDCGCARTEGDACDRCRRGGGLRRGKSLLPAGVVAIEGSFARGDAVIIRGPDGAEIGRGLVAYDVEDALKIRGRSSADIPGILGFSGRAEMVHRDDLAVQPVNRPAEPSAGAIAQERENPGRLSQPGLNAG